MAKNFIQAGNTITAMAPEGGIVSGEGVLIGNLFGVAATGAPAGQQFEMATTGVYELPKRLSATFTSCGAVSWDIAVRQCTNPGVGFYPIGVATVAATGTGTRVQVRLDGVSTSESEV